MNIFEVHLKKKIREDRSIYIFVLMQFNFFSVPFKLGNDMEQYSSSSIITGRNAAPAIDLSRRLNADKYNMKLLSGRTIRKPKNVQLLQQQEKIFPLVIKWECISELCSTVILQTSESWPTHFSTEAADQARDEIMKLKRILHTHDTELLFLIAKAMNAANYGLKLKLKRIHTQGLHDF